MTSNSSLRVLHIIASVDRATGGPIQGLIQGLELRRSLGQHIEVVSLDNPDDSCVADFPGIVHAVGRGILKYRYNPRLTRWIVENSDRFDVSVIHGLWNHASVGGWMGLRKTKIPYVVFTHGMMDPWFKKQYPIKHLIKQIFWIFQGKVLRDADAVLFTSAAEMSLSSNVFYGPKFRSRTISYAAGEALSLEERDARIIDEVCPGITHLPYILYLGRINEKKGIDLLLHGFANSSIDKDTHLLIAGPDPDRLTEKLKELASELGISDRVHWAGMITGRHKASAFINSQAFALSSYQENFGISVAEALSYSKPVLISDQVNIWREISSGGGGLVRPATLCGVRDLMDCWAKTSSNEREIMGLNARAVYDKHFTLESAVKDLAEVLNQACAEKRIISCPQDR